MSRFEIRAATSADAAGLYEVARHLNSVNLPADKTKLERALLHSEKSFRGDIENPKEREYVFVLIDHEASDKVIGSSMVFGQLGRRGAPYIYLDVLPEERYSSTVDTHVRHTTLRIGYSYEGGHSYAALKAGRTLRAIRSNIGACSSRMG